MSSVGPTPGGPTLRLRRHAARRASYLSPDARRLSLVFWIGTRLDHDNDLNDYDYEPR
jgi:hypothetical protein